MTEALGVERQLVLPLACLAVLALACGGGGVSAGGGGDEEASAGGGAGASGGGGGGGGGGGDGSQDGSGSLCVAAAPCALASVCHSGSTSCATGAPECVDTGAPLVDGTACAPGKYCASGACAVCSSGQVCGLEKQFEETSYSFNDLYLADGLVGWAVGEPHWDQARKAYAGTIARTADGGATWTAQEAGVAVSLRAVAFVDSLNGWAAGASGTVLRTRDGGQSWVAVPAFTADDLGGLSFADANDGWATSTRPIHAGAFGHADNWRASVWRTNDGGATWTEQALPAGASVLRRIRFLDAQRGWTVGAKYLGDDSYGRPVHGAAVYHTADGGQHWSELYAPDRRFTFVDVHFVDAQEGWVAGFMTWSSETGGTVFHTADGGLTWAQQDAGGFSTPLSSVRFADRLRGYAVGGGVYRTLDGGQHWTLLNNLPTWDSGFEEGPMASAVAVAGDRVLIVGQRDVVIGSSGAWAPCVQGAEQGTRCEDLYTNSYANIHYRFEDVFFTDESHGWAVGKRSFKPGFTGQVIFHTDDGGATWAEQYESAPPLDSLSSLFRLDGVFFVDALDGWAVGRSEMSSDLLNHGAILHTSDGGLHWAEQGAELATGLAPEFFAVHFLDAQNGWALDKGHYDSAAQQQMLYLARTSDGGATWQWVETGIPGGLAIGFALVQGGLTFTDALHGWAVGGNGTVIHTADGGDTWTSQPLPDSWTHMNGVAFVDGQIGWIAGEYLYGTTDGGATWTRKEISKPGDLADVAFPDALHGWLAGDGGAVLRTSDGGATWTALESGTRVALRGLSFVSAQRGWFVGDRGTILRTVP